MVTNVKKPAYSKLYNSVSETEVFMNVSKYAAEGEKETIAEVFSAYYSLGSINDTVLKVLKVSGIIK